MSIKSRDLATSLFKAFDALSVLNTAPAGLTIGELVEALGFPRSSLVRMLDSLAYYGFVERADNRRYFVTDGFRLWRSEKVNDSLISLYRPLMRKICREVGEMVVLGRLEGRRIRHIHYEEPDQRIRVIPPVNRRFKLETMAMGKLAISVREDLIPKNCSREFIDEIETVRKEGCAWNRGESEPDIIAWGTWLDEPSPLVPMLAITWPDFRFSENALERVRGILDAELRKV